ncbi:hypothetical protein ACQCVP_13280 [Rossellomorea vietnamensis]|uniref:hypothetical protein n=1 Tax=Rossellomorea vietnamensis TaxID=218284 RepID=UPI003CF6CAFF
MRTDIQSLAEKCLYNWLGYGNENSKIWFMGMEEGGSEIWRQQTKTLEESLQLRSGYKIGMDFQHVWEDLYGIPLESFKGPTVWRYMAAFLLSMKGEEPSGEKIRSYIFEEKKLGKRESDHFLCEFLPLPRKSNTDIEDYQSMWTSNSSYIKSVGARRFELIKETLLKNSDVSLLISYDRKFTSAALAHFQSELLLKWEDKRFKEYAIYTVRLTPDRNVYFLTTPFFGQGKASYEGLYFAAKKIKELAIL